MMLTLNDLVRVLRQAIAIDADRLRKQGDPHGQEARGFADLHTPERPEQILQVVLSEPSLATATPYEGGEPWDTPLEALGANIYERLVLVAAQAISEL